MDTKRSAIIKWLLVFVLFSIAAVSALVIHGAQDRANPRPTKTIVRPVSARTLPTKTVSAPLCIVPVDKPTRTPVPSGIERRTMVRLSAEYACYETDGSQHTHTFEFGMLIYDPLQTVPETVCPMELQGGNWRINGRCLAPNPQGFPEKSPTPRP